uniref:Bm1673, isoform a n=1 Tax=Brugia malayi TaxID=6279 RepID=A0A1I9G2A6_BRUMA|nr:Bm1673, isoform a [Brugia malayi]
MKTLRFRENVVLIRKSSEKIVRINWRRFFNKYGLQAVLFLTHTVTGISVWSWLLLSTLRYLAIRHPLFHLQLWQMPYRALSFIIVSFIIYTFGCIQQALFRSLTWNRLFHIVECAWSFCVPCLLIFVMDISVLIKST